MQLYSKIISIQQPIFFLVLLLFNACEWTEDPAVPKDVYDGSALESFDAFDSAGRETTRYYSMLEQNGFVDLTSVDSTIAIDLRYATPENFTGKNLYGIYSGAYLQREIADMLCHAQRLLKHIDTGMSLILFDATRPRSVQYEMWDNVNATGKTKLRFLSDPNKISMHNMGLAVDVGIVLTDSTLLDMGTTFDFIGELAYPCLENYFLEQGLLGYNHLNNRSILAGVMTDAGFNANKYEWWHFSKYTKEYAISHYAVVEDFSAMTSPDREKTLATLEELTFNVQIAASYRKLDEKRFCVADVFVYRHDGMNKYYSGNFSDLEQAYRHRDSVRKQGCKGAFVIAFYKGVRIAVADALKMQQF